MKIDSSITKTTVSLSGERKVTRTPPPKTETPASAGASDEVKLTSGSQLQAMGSTLGTAQPVDTAKVEAIKQAISEGRFQVNPEKIADRLLTSVQELLANRKG